MYVNPNPTYRLDSTVLPVKADGDLELDLLVGGGLRWPARDNLTRQVKAYKAKQHK
jgi:hypothetical protein